MDKNALKAEIRRLNDILVRADVPDHKRDALTPVIENTAWLRLKLDETREEMNLQSVTCEYDNGGGQHGIRQNPIYKGYVEIYKAYLQGFKTYLDCLPPELQIEAKNDDGITVLSQVLSMKKGLGYERKSKTKNTN